MLLSSNPSSMSADVRAAAGQTTGRSATSSLSDFFQRAQEIAIVAAGWINTSFSNRDTERQGLVSSITRLHSSLMDATSDLEGFLQRRAAGSVSASDASTFADTFTASLKRTLEASAAFTSEQKEAIRNSPDGRLAVLELHSELRKLALLGKDHISAALGADSAAEVAGDFQAIHDEIKVAAREFKIRVRLDVSKYAIHADEVTENSVVASETEDKEDREDTVIAASAVAEERDPEPLTPEAASATDAEQIIEAASDIAPVDVPLAIEPPEGEDTESASITAPMVAAREDAPEPAVPSVAPVLMAASPGDAGLRIDAQPGRQLRFPRALRYAAVIGLAALAWVGYSVSTKDRSQSSPSSEPAPALVTSAAPQDTPSLAAPTASPSTDNQSQSPRVAVEEPKSDPAVSFDAPPAVALVPAFEVLPQPVPRIDMPKVGLPGDEFASAAPAHSDDTPTISAPTVPDNIQSPFAVTSPLVLKMEIPVVAPVSPSAPESTSTPALALGDFDSFLSGGAQSTPQVVAPISEAPTGSLGILDSFLAGAALPQLPSKQVSVAPAVTAELGSLDSFFYHSNLLPGVTVTESFAPLNPEGADTDGALGTLDSLFGNAYPAGLRSEPGSPDLSLAAAAVTASSPVDTSLGSYDSISAGIRLEQGSSSAVVQAAPDSDTSLGSFDSFSLALRGRNYAGLSNSGLGAVIAGNSGARELDNYIADSQPVALGSLDSIPTAERRPEQTQVASLTGDGGVALGSFDSLSSGVLLRRGSQPIADASSDDSLLSRRRSLSMQPTTVARVDIK